MQQGCLWSARSIHRVWFDRARLNARVDPLTALGNRRAFEIESRKLALAYARDGRALLCGLIDLDDFKNTNDRSVDDPGDCWPCQLRADAVVCGL